MSEFIANFFSEHVKSIIICDETIEKIKIPLGLSQDKAIFHVEDPAIFDPFIKILPQIKPIYRKIDIGSQIKFEQWHSYRRTILAILSECEFVTRSEIFSRGFRYKFIDEIINPNNQEIRIPMIILCGYKYKRKMEMTLSKLVKRGIIRRHKIGPYTYYNLKKKQEK